MTQHHVKPSSRGGEDKNNIVLWDDTFHKRFHTLFDNMTLEEIIQFITIVSTPNGSFTKRYIALLKRRIKLDMYTEKMTGGWQ